MSLDHGSVIGWLGAFGPDRILTVAFLGVLTLSVLYIFKQRVLSPLGKVPGPWLASVSPLWRVYCVARGDWHDKIIKLHRRYGKWYPICPSSYGYKAHLFRPIRLNCTKRVVNNVAFRYSCRLQPFGKPLGQGKCPTSLNPLPVSTVAHLYRMSGMRPGGRIKSNTQLSSRRMYIGTEASDAGFPSYTPCPMYSVCSGKS